MSQKKYVVKWLLFSFCLGLPGLLPLPLSAQAPASEAIPLEEQIAEITAETSIEPAGGDEPGTPAAPDGKDAEHWFDKGVLLSVYGSYPAAAGAFKKAIEMAPDWAAAHFQLGVAYGEMGNFADAFKAVNDAIALDPQRGDFYYGRGRLYLMTGDSAKAMADFEKAAELGSKDAIRFLKAGPSPGM